MNLPKILDRIMNCDPYVRFAVIIDKDGNKVESRLRDGLENFLPPQEMDKSLQNALGSWKSRNDRRQFLGNNQYVLAVYDKVKRVTVPIGEDHLLLVALDNKGGQKDIVDRILAIIEGDYTKITTPGPQY